jgi:addiction module HigA family antidote
VTRQQLYNIINGKSGITPDMAFAWKSTADHWLRLQAAYDLAQARNRISDVRIKRLRPKAV